MNKAILSVFTLAAVMAFVQSLPLSNEDTLAFDQISSGGSKQSLSDVDNLLVSNEQNKTRTKRCLCCLPILGRVLGCYPGDRPRYQPPSNNYYIGNGENNGNNVHIHHHG